MGKFVTALTKLDDRYAEIAAIDNMDEALRIKHQECEGKLEGLKKFLNKAKVEIAKAKAYLKDVSSGKKVGLPNLSGLRLESFLRLENLSPLRLESLSLLRRQSLRLKN